MNPTPSPASVWWFDPDAFPGWMDWLALLLTVVGFVIAFIQLRKTRSAAEHATAALTSAQAQLSERAIHAIAPQFQHAQEDIQAAMKSGDGSAAQRALVRFAKLANEAADVLNTSFAEQVALASELTAASEKATKAKVAIATKPGTNIASALLPVYKDADSVMMSVDKLSAHLRNHVEGGSSV